MPPIDALLAPIDESRPSGDDLSFSADFDVIAEARRHDDPTLDQGAWVVPLKEADWKQVVERCTMLLATRTKDLRLAVWLAEAGAKEYGLQGLADGFRLIAGLCGQYWDTMHPVPDNGDLERRIGNLAWFLDRTCQLLAEMPLTEGRETSYSQADLDAARAREAAGNSAPQQGGAPLAAIEAARRKSSRSFYQSLLDQSADCRHALSDLEHAVDARLGIDGPGFAATRAMLDRVTDTIHEFADLAGVRIPPAALSRNGFTDAAMAPSAKPVLANGSPAGTAAEDCSAMSACGLQSRAEALQQLREIADFFRRTEPHSPVAYLAEKAVAWGEMPLHQWLQAVIKDGASLSHVEALLGIVPELPQQ